MDNTKNDLGAGCKFHWVILYLLGWNINGGCIEFGFVFWMGFSETNDYFIA